MSAAFISKLANYVRKPRSLLPNVTLLLGTLFVCEMRSAVGCLITVPGRNEAARAGPGGLLVTGIVCWNPARGMDACLCI
jgi:hypothetical protein